MFGIKRLRLKQPSTHKPVYEFEVSNWFGRWMWDRGWGGVTEPLPFFHLLVYWVLPGEHVDPIVRVHEFVHVAQSERQGWFVRGWVSYGVENVEDGLAGRGWYADNKFEQEAYAIQAEAERHGLPEWAKP